MSKLRLISRRLADQRGQTLVEYGLIIAFIAIALVTALSTFGSSLITIYNSIAAAIP